MHHSRLMVSRRSVDNVLPSISAPAPGFLWTIHNGYICLHGGGWIVFALSESTLLTGRPNPIWLRNRSLTPVIPQLMFGHYLPLWHFLRWLYDQSIHRKPFYSRTDFPRNGSSTLAFFLFGWARWVYMLKVALMFVFPISWQSSVASQLTPKVMDANAWRCQRTAREVSLHCAASLRLYLESL